MRLAKYEHILDPTDVQSLIALTSYYNGYFEQCSRAFTKLETADDCPQDKRDGFSDLAMDIFTSNAPSDPVQIDGLDGVRGPPNLLESISPALGSLARALLAQLLRCARKRHQRQTLLVLVEARKDTAVLHPLL